MAFFALKKYQQEKPALPESIWRNPWHFIAFGFGAGCMPFAPGTFGTLMAIPFYLAIQTLAWPLYLFLLCLISLGSIILCDRVSKEIKVEDHQGMCLDEIVGFLFTMFLAPTGWLWIALGFLFFRFFDILKPWPLSWVDENVHGGFGMILDDILAGICSCLLLQVLAWVLLT